MFWFAGTVTVDVTPVALLSGIGRFTSIGPTLVLISAGTGVHVLAMLTAARASIDPNPYLWLMWKPAPLVVHPGPVGSFFRAVRTRMFSTSRTVRLGLASSIRAITPDTSGVADEVPPNPLV